jgi:hypothetical protein
MKKICVACVWMNIYQCLSSKQISQDLRKTRISGSVWKASVPNSLITLENTHVNGLIFYEALVQLYYLVYKLNSIRIDCASSFSM